MRRYGNGLDPRAFADAFGRHFGPLCLLAYTLGSTFTGESISELVVPQFEWHWDELSNNLRELMYWALSMGDTLLIGLIMEVLFAGAGYLLVRLSWRMRVVHEWRKRQMRVPERSLR